MRRKNFARRGPVVVYLLIGVVTAIGTIPTNGQTNGTLTGVVTDSTNALVPGATITIRAITSGIEKTVISDAQGRYRVENLISGNYKLTVKSTDLTTKVLGVVVESGETRDFNISLDPAGITSIVQITEEIEPIPTTGLKTATPLIEIPQSISLITREQLTLQSPLTLQESLRYTSGVYADPYGLDSRGDWAIIRGGETTLQLFNGLRTVFDYNNNTRPDIYTLEQVEILKGPSSVLYGQGGFNGVVNLVPKKPHANSSREITAQFGNFSRKQFAADFTGAIDSDDKLLYRAIGLWRDSDTQVNYVPDNRYLFTPSIVWKPYRSTQLYLVGNMQRDAGGSSVAFFPPEGALFPHSTKGYIPTETFIGEPEVDEYKTRQSFLAYFFEQHIGEKYSARHSLRYTDSYGSIQEFYSSFPPSYDASGTAIPRSLFVQKTNLNTYVSDTHLESRFRTGQIRHTLLGGIDNQRATLKIQTGSNYAVPALDVFNPVYTNNVIFPTLETRPRQLLKQTGLYAQDQTKLFEKVVVTGAIRRDWAKIDERTSASHNINEYEATTGKVGFVYLASRGLSPYFSYSQSFNPTPGYNAKNEPFIPLRGEIIEVGTRYQPSNGSGIFSLAFYQMKEKNRITYDSSDPANPFAAVQLGEARIRGIEAEADISIIKKIKLNASYTFTEAVVTQSSTLSEIGNRLETVPKHLGKLWAIRTFNLNDTNGITVGGGVRVTGSNWDAHGAIRTPAYTLLDSMVAYNHNTWRMSLNVSNLTDKRYVTTCRQWGDCFLGLRRQVTANISYRF